MDENTWRFAQIMMWIIGIQTTVIMAALGGMWMTMNKRFENIENKLDKIDQKVTDIDKRVFAMETMLHMKDCCMLKDSRLREKAE
jgi:hypothetical protein